MTVAYEVQPRPPSPRFHSTAMLNTSCETAQRSDHSRSLSTSSRIATSEGPGMDRHHDRRAEPLRMPRRFLPVRLSEARSNDDGNVSAVQRVSAATPSAAF